MRRRGVVFAFEGPDGVGKTTLVSAVREALAGLRQPVLALSFPGRASGTLGAHIYELHHKPAAHGVHTLTPDGLQLLHIAAHVDTIQSVIRPHVEKGGIVLLDRYWWSTWVYGRLSGVEPESLRRMIDLEQSYWGALAPRAIFLVTRPCVDADQRVLFHRRTSAYDVLAEQEQIQSRVVRIENRGDIKVVADATVQIIHQLIDTESEPFSLRRTARSRVEAAIADAHKLPYDAVAPSGTETTPSKETHAVSVWARLAPAKPTAVFDTYWRFAAERQAIFFRRFNGFRRPWTEDPILNRYKFTNAYRASDRVSQYLIRHVIYEGDQSPREIFFRVLLFKFFNRIETWQRLVAAFDGPSTKTFVLSRYDEILTAALEAGESIYSGAYIMPTGGADWRDDRKHRMHLRLLEYMLSEDLPERIVAARTMREAFELLKSFPTVGDFLAYQYVTDLNYSTATNFGEDEFVVPGPGARDGIRKCFSTLGGLNEADLIKFVRDRQEEEFDARALAFESLWGRPLQLIDCQNLFCEVDKYARVYHPDVKVKSGRSRIKQQFRPTSTLVAYWYPPKWELNDRIPSMTLSEIAIRSREDERHDGAHHQ